MCKRLSGVPIQIWQGCFSSQYVLRRSVVEHQLHINWRNLVLTHIRYLDVIYMWYMFAQKCSPARTKETTSNRSYSLRLLLEWQNPKEFVLRVKELTRKGSSRWVPLRLSRFHPETQRHNTVNSIKDGRSKYQLVKSEGPINSKFEAETKLQLLKDTINHHVLSSIFMPIRCELQAWKY
jgi:hypothetical protein